ncbi:hypothetical protein AZE42_09607 [Rhizopogon vesiculosus]|uniref:Uncharacterized protein n=1 Tax=Rhizopogon vesiculosus TaxID=180088 RepID=A0A1J8QBU5_9AGAM|nr:hypothetical protein AZE42_09607 [Rhizopogon vesiculosus]
MTSYPDDIDQPDIIDVSGDEYDSSDEEDEFAPVPEDLIQGLLTGQKNQDKGDTKVPTVIKRPTDKEARKIKADKYKADKDEADKVKVNKDKADKDKK